MSALPEEGFWGGSETWALDDALGLRLAHDLAVISRSALFDADWYVSQPPGTPADTDPLTHYVTQGCREGRWPNPYFDSAWDLARNPDVARSGMNPLLHYITAGEAEGRPPSARFDLAWYAQLHQTQEGMLLAHFLARRHAGQVSPLPEFDAQFYLSRYPDVAAAGVDPAEHRNKLRLHTTPPASEATVFDETCRFTRPGPYFEEVQPLPRAAPRQGRALAYYLPQFHAVPENDAWWGRGVTEWTAISRGVPRFVGHYQPRVPRDLGHYNLGPSAGAETMRRQIALARGGDLDGFVHYFYWFNGKRLLELPLETWLADPSLDFPFCLMWANDFGGP